MTLSGLRAGFKTALETITTLKRVHTEVPDAISQTPCAIVGDPTGNYDDSMSGTNVLTFPIHVLVAHNDAKRGQIAVDDFIDSTGSSSIHAVLEGSTLGGAAADTNVLRWDTYGAHYLIGETTYIGVTFYAQVWAP